MSTRRSLKRNYNTLRLDDAPDLSAKVEKEVDVDGHRWRHVFKRWLVNQGPTFIFLTLWIAANVEVFVNTFLVYRLDPKFKIIFGIMGWSLSFSRAAGAGLNLNIAFLVLAVCRNLIRYFYIRF